MSAKAQVVSIDTFVGLTVFVFVLLSGMWAWHHALQKSIDTQERIDLSLVADNAASVLFNTPGNPTYWHTLSQVNASTVSAIGLMSGGRVDIDKTSKLVQVANATDTKRILGVLGPGYNYTVELRPAGGNPSLIAGVVPTGASRVEVRTYYGQAINDSLVELRLKVWR